MEFISSFAVGYGRIARGAWLFRIAVLAATCTAFGMLGQAIAGETGAALFAALFVWCALSVSVKRLHDIGRSAWFLAVLAIPVLGPLWLALQLCKRGVEGRNRYGRDPMARMGYLTVDISK